MDAPIRKAHGPPSPIFIPKLSQLFMPTSRLPPQGRASFPSWRRRWLEAVSKQELYKVKSFPHALGRLSPPGAHLAAHLHPAAGAVLRTAFSCPCTRQPKKKITLKIPHAPLTQPEIHDSTRRFPRGLPLRVLPPRASWPLGRCRRRARCALAGTGAASRAEALGTPPQPRGLAGGGGKPGGGERQQEEGHGGARSQSAAQIIAQPAGRSADSPVGSELPLPPLLLAASLLPAPHHSDADAQPSPSSSSPPLAFLLLSPPPKPREKRARGRKTSASGMTSDLGARRRGEGAGGKGGCGGGEASWRALPAPGLKAGLILEL